MTEVVGDTAGLGSWRREPKTVIRRASDMATDAPATFVIRAESEVPRVPLEWEPHSHPMHELVWVRGGTLTSRVGDQLFTVSEGSGLWLPADVVHAGRLTAQVEFHYATFAPESTPVAFDGPTVIEMTHVLESLLGHLARTDLDTAARSRAESVVFDVLAPSARQLTLHLPGGTGIAMIAETLLDDPADDRSLEDWAQALGINGRTITRAFRRSTGLPFVQWRQALRVHHALTLLSEGCDVQSVSEQIGYAQPSTFIAAFRRVMGTTPGAFVTGQRPRLPVSEKP